jgi:NTP pyrophosphatase (non-canonical NTP hydrolase)
MIGETGEVVDLIKKHLYQGHPMDESLRLKLTKEIGDTMWYICMVANLCDIWMEDVIATNVEKLQARYPEGFTVEKSINRDTEEK